jgi:hypothetical protein
MKEGHGCLLWVLLFLAIGSCSDAMTKVKQREMELGEALARENELKLQLDVLRRAAVQEPEKGNP